MKSNFFKDIIIIIIITIVSLFALNIVFHYWLMYSEKNDVTYIDIEKNFLNKYSSIIQDQPEKKFSKYLTIYEINPPNLRNDIFYIQNPANTNIIFCEEENGLIEFTTDKFGFRNKNGKNKYDVIILGDSFTEGACVDDEKSIPGVINSRKKVSIYNGGKGGTGLIYFALAADKLSNEIKNKIIAVNLIQGISINRMFSTIKNYPNIFEQKLEFLDEEKKLSLVNHRMFHKLYFEKYNELRIKKFEDDSFFLKSKKLISHTALYLGLKKIFKNYVYYTGERAPVCDKLNENRLLIKKSIKSLYNTSVKNESKLVIFYIPTFWNYMKDVDNNFYRNLSKNSDCEFNLIKKIASEIDSSVIIEDKRFIFEGFPHKEIRDIYFANNHDLRFTMGLSYVRGHYSEIGFEKISDSISLSLQNILSNN